MAVLVLKWLLKTLMCVSQSIDFFLTSTVLKTEYIMIYAAQPRDILIYMD